MPGKKMKKGAYEMNHAMKMKHSPMPMKGPYNMRPSILNQMSHNK